MYRAIIDAKPEGKAAFGKLRFTGFYGDEPKSEKTVKEMKEQCLENVKKSVIDFDPQTKNWTFVMTEFKKVKMNFLIFESAMNNKKTEV